MSAPTTDEIQRQITELTALRKSTRRWQLATTLLIVVILCAGIGSILNSVMGLAKAGPVQDKFVAELQSGLKKQVVPELDRLVKSSLSDVKRDVEVELKKVNERSPELVKALNKELEILQHGLPQRGEKIMEATLGRELKSREGKIKGMFPGVKEEDVASLVNNLVSESHSSMENLSKTLFGRHLQALTTISANLDIIKRTEKINPDEDLANWETALSIMDLMRDEIKPGEGENTKAAKTSAEKKEAK